MSKQRIDYIDVAKGLCMILVVWQHVHTYYLDLETGEFYMESFRMPLFFLISGMFFKMYTGFDVFAKKKINTLLIPFLFFYLTLSVLLPNFLHIVGYEGLRESSSLGWNSLFNCIFYKVYSNSTVWFLLALLWLNYLFYGIMVIAKRFGEGKQVLIMAILSMSCGLLGFFIGVNRLFVWANMDNALTATPFFFVGFWLKNKTNITTNPPKRVILFLFLFFSMFYIFMFSHGLSFKQNKWEIGDFIPLYTCGVIGSLGIISLSRLLEKSRLLKYYGENSLIILCMQMPVIQVVNLIVKKLSFSEMGEFLLTFILVMIAFLVVIPVMNMYLPWFTGKKNLIR